MDEILAIEVAIEAVNDSYYADKNEVTAALKRAQDYVVKGYMYDLLKED